MEYKLRVLSMHEIGQRANQEDYMYPAPGMANDNDRCFVLCDGMGGHDSGEVASQAVCNTMGGYVSGNCPSDMVFTADDLRAALAAAYDELDARDTHAAKKMGTTMTFANFHKGGCLVAHMGDSRVYHMRPSVGILFETRDHSLVNDLIKVGELTEETAKTFKQKNVITRCMQPNNERRSRADIKEITDIRPGDYFFMCSDGVNEVMESRHLANVILDDSFTDDEKIAIIRDNTTEARDNHTAYLIHVLDVKGAPLVRREAPVAEPIPASEKPKSKVKSKIVLPGIALLALLSAVVYFTVFSPSEQATADVPHSPATVGKPAENNEVGGKELSGQLNSDEVTRGSQVGSNDKVDNTGTADTGGSGNSSAANANESGNGGSGNSSAANAKNGDNDGAGNTADANAGKTGKGSSDNTADANAVKTGNGGSGNSSAANANDSGNGGSGNTADANAVKTGNGGSGNTADANAVKTGNGGSGNTADANAVKTDNGGSGNTADANAVKTGNGGSGNTADVNAVKTDNGGSGNSSAANANDSGNGGSGNSSAANANDSGNGGSGNSSAANANDSGNGGSGNSSAANANDSGNGGSGNSSAANANDSGNDGSDNTVDAEGVGTDKDEQDAGE